MSTDPGKLDYLLAQEPTATADYGAYLKPAAHGHSRWLTLGQYFLTASIFLAGFHLWRIGSINLTVSDLAFLIAFGALLSYGRVSSVPFGLMTPLWLTGLSLMLGSLFFSTLFNGDLSRWIVIAIQYIFAFFFIPVVLTAQGRDRVRQLVLVFVLGVTAMELAGVTMSMMFNYNSAPGFLGKGFFQGNGRLGTFAGEPNWNGSLVAMAVTMLIYCVKERLIPIWGALLCAGTLIWGLLLSATVTGFTATLAASIVMIFMLGARYLMRFALVLFAAAALFTVSGAPLPEIFSKRVGGALSSGDIEQAGTFTHRAELIREAWQMTEETSIIGVGADEFRNVSVEHQPVHNLYLLIWTEGGLPALIGLVMLLCLIPAMAIAAPRRARTDSALVLAVFVVLLIYTMSSPHMYTRLFIMPVMIALSLLFAKADVPLPRLRSQSVLARQ